MKGKMKRLSINFSNTICELKPDPNVFTCTVLVIYCNSSINYIYVESLRTEIRTQTSLHVGLPVICKSSSYNKINCICVINQLATVYIILQPPVSMTITMPYIFVTAFNVQSFSSFLNIRTF